MSLSTLVQFQVPIFDAAVIITLELNAGRVPREYWIPQILSFKISCFYPSTGNTENSNPWNERAVKTNVFNLASEQAVQEVHCHVQCVKWCRWSAGWETAQVGVQLWRRDYMSKDMFHSDRQGSESSWNDSLVNPCSSINQIVPARVFNELKRNWLHI